VNALTLVLAQWRRRAAPTALSFVLLALAVAMLAYLLMMQAQLARQLVRDAQGVDLVVGAKGSPLQLILSAVYHVDVPTGNVPLAAVQRLREHRLVQQVIPVSLGDNYRGFRIVGTEPALIDLYGGRIAAGALWQDRLEAVLGSRVARETRLGPGAVFIGTHGLAEGGFEHDDAPYRVVGVLAPTGTVLDRLILTDLDSVWFVHEGEPRDEQERRILEESREVTAALVRYASPLAAAVLPRQLNAEPNLLAAVPAAELARLFAMAGVGIEVMRAFALILFAAALLALFVALMQALEERRYDLAVMRLVGASPRQVAVLLLTESWLLALAATAAGLALGVAALQATDLWLARSRSFDLSAWAWSPQLAGVVVLALGVATAAAIWPAWRAARMDLHRTLASG
jgi:putative ABC transport system permease protein